MGRFKHLVDSEKGMKNFRTKYNSPPNMGVRYAVQGEWFDERKNRRGGHPHDRFHRGGNDHPYGDSH